MVEVTRLATLIKEGTVGFYYLILRKFLNSLFYFVAYVMLTLDCICWVTHLIYFELKLIRRLPYFMLGLLTDKCFFHRQFVLLSLPNLSDERNLTLFLLSVVLSPKSPLN